MNVSRAHEDQRPGAFDCRLSHHATLWLHCLCMGNVHIWPFLSLAEGVGSVSESCSLLYVFSSAVSYTLTYMLVYT